MPEPTVVPARFPALTATLDRSHADVLPVGTDREAARAAGFAAGFAAGARAAARVAEAARRRVALDRDAAARDAEARLAAALRALAAAADAARSRSAPVVAQAESLLHERAIELAGAVLGVELRDDETAAEALLARVRAAAGTADRVEVRLNPHDLALVATLPGLPAGVELVGDPAIGRGGAYAEHAAGWLDGRIDEALRRARAALDGEQ